MEMKQADRIRHFAVENYITLARQRGQRTMRLKAGEIHRAMGLSNAMPAVVSAIEARKFRDLARVTLLERTGPHAGSTVTWVFQLD